MTHLSRRLLSVAVLVCLLSTPTAARPTPTPTDDANNGRDNIFVSISSIGQTATTIQDPTNVVQTIEHATKRYDDLRTEYFDMKCTEIWGPFPLTSTRTKENINITKGKGAMTCSCGLIHDLAVSQLVLLEAIRGGGGGDAPGIHPNIVSSETETAITPLDAWVLSQTSHGQARCENGMAAGFPCNNIDLVAHIPLSSLEATNTRQPPEMGNDLWGWTSEETGREFVVWGVSEGHFFTEVTGSFPKLLGFMPTTTGRSAFQHDAKVIGDYAYMGAETKNHGIKIFDMKRLLDIDPETECVGAGYCQELVPDRVYRGTWSFPVGKSHNIVVNEGSNFVYIVGGGNGCSGGLHVVDVTNPGDPSFVACFGNDGYVHDAQCVNYRGPDARYQATEICFCYNEDAVVIVDVTNKSDIRILSTTGYIDFEYTHQGWLSSDHSHILFGDEVDEIKGAAFDRTRTLVLNVTDLENPTGLKEHFGTTAAIDHNLYVARVSSSTKAIDTEYDGNSSSGGVDVVFQANYKAGLRIAQVFDYGTADIREIAYFDTFPLSDTADFDGGAWSVFPYFRSGLVAIGSIDGGLFLVRPDLGAALVGIDPPRRKRKKNNKKKKAKNRSRNANTDRRRIRRVRRY